jgi:hypothetical protein
VDTILPGSRAHREGLAVDLVFDGTLPVGARVDDDPVEVFETYAEDLPDSALLDIALGDAIDAVVGGEILGATDDIAVWQVRMRTYRLIEAAQVREYAAFLAERSGGAA